MDKKAERLVKRAEKAGVRFVKREHHIPTEDELLEIKIQVLPNSWRIFLLICSVGFGIGSYLAFSAGEISAGIALALAAILFFLFGVLGVKKTLEHALNSLDVVDVGEILGVVKDGVVEAASFLDF